MFEANIKNPMPVLEVNNLATVEGRGIPQIYACEKVGLNYFIV